MPCSAILRLPGGPIIHELFDEDELFAHGEPFVIRGSR
jgi:hypothetical protein